MALQAILREIFNLWKKSYIFLFPQILLITFCFDSDVFIHNIFMAAFLYLPGIYLSNYLLLTLSGIYHNNIYPEKYYYDLALSRLLETLVLFLGLAAVFFILVLLGNLLFGLIGAVIVTLILLIIYSYMIFSYAFVVIQNQKPVEAIKSSFKLINRHIWLITGIFLAVGILEGLSYLLLFVLFGANISGVIYNLLFTTANLALSVIVLNRLSNVGL